MCSLRTYLNSYSAVRRDAGTTYTVHNSRAGISFLFGGLVVNLFSLSLYVFLLLEFLIQLTGQPWSLSELFNRQSRRFSGKVESSRIVKTVGGKKNVRKRGFSRRDACAPVVLLRWEINIKRVREDKARSSFQSIFLRSCLNHHTIWHIYLG